jgi:molecular chaperone GrpE (heat shock protein)
MPDDPNALLNFEPAPGPDAKEWTAAEREAVKFSSRFVKKAQELMEARQQLQQLGEENDKLRDRLYRFVIRNLIGVLDNCKAALAQPADASEAGRLEGATLSSIVRSLLYVLEQLGARRLELLGRTYENVEVNGQKIDDPFEVLESSQKGKASEITVREVVGDLWVLERNGYVEVLQRGRVIC